MRSALTYPIKKQELSPVRVLLTMPYRTLQRSTDREYIYKRFVRISKHHAVEFLPNDSIRSVVYFGADYAVRRVTDPWLNKVGIQRASSLRLPVRRPAQSDVAFSYGIYPQGTGSLPVVWEQTFAPIDLDIDEEKWSARMVRERTALARDAHTVVSASEASVRRFKQLFPFASDKVRHVPYYLPDVEPISTDDMEAKFREPNRLRVLFIGKEARRKGLETIVNGFKSLSASQRSTLHFTVVSAFLDGTVEMPAEFSHYRFVPDIQALLRESHVLAFPTKSEAFGLVLVEAMAAGCAVITTRNEIQQSIVGNSGGAFIDPRSAAEFASAIGGLADNISLAREMGIANLTRFSDQWHHTRVGKCYADLFFRAAGRDGVKTEG